MTIEDTANSSYQIISMKRFDIWGFDRWSVLSERECRPFEKNGTSIWFVQVLAGKVWDGKSPKPTPIIKWLPRKDFYREKNRGERL